MQEGAEVSFQRVSISLAKARNAAVGPGTGWTSHRRQLLHMNRFLCLKAGP
jgi:hypothetical protein